MSTSRLIFSQLAWSELLEILSFLSLKDVYLSCGRLNRSGFITFLRERISRRAISYIEDLKFLPGLSTHEKVLIVSYPRSGNSYFRQILETETGIITGSDSRSNRTLSSSLLQCGFKGEGITDSSVWLVKSHYPERSGYIKFNIARVILLVRNPFDAIESYFNMGMTNTHDKHLSSQAFQDLAGIWKDFVANESKVWADFHEFWLRCRSSFPTTIIRYEDLLSCPETIIGNISDFLSEGRTPMHLMSEKVNFTYEDSSQSLPLQDIVPTVNNKRKKLRQGTKTLQADVSSKEFVPRYKPKKGGIGKALSIMKQDEIDVISNNTASHMSYFGYKLNESQGRPTLSLSTFDGCSSNYSSLAKTASSPQGIGSYYNTQLEMPSTGLIKINDGIEIRTEEDRFGRKMTALRKSLTNDDKSSLETI